MRGTLLGLTALAGLAIASSAMASGTYSNGFANAVAIPDSPGPSASLGLFVGGDSVNGTLVSSITVGLNIRHTWQGDLIVTLQAPGGGPTITLLNRAGAGGAGGNGFSNDNFGNFTTSTRMFFVDGAPNGVYDVAPNGTAVAADNITGNWRAAGAGPGASLNGTFGGFNSLGVWTLTAQDFAGGDVGTIDGFEITLLTTPAPGSLALLGLGGLAAARRRRRVAAITAAVAGLAFGSSAMAQLGSTGPNGAGPNNSKATRNTNDWSSPSANGSLSLYRQRLAGNSGRYTGASGLAGQGGTTVDGADKGDFSPAVPGQPTRSVTWPGPDAFGYTGTSSTGNTFAPIKGNGGVRLTPADPAAATYDDRFYSAPVGFSFPFYGSNNTTAFATTNGFISFGGTTNTAQTLDSQISASYTNATFNSATAIPSGSNLQLDRQMICPWWDDLQFTTGQAGGIYTLNRVVAGLQEFVVEWNNVAFFNSTTDGVSFQVIMRSNGTIEFNYGDSASSNAGNTLGASATIGIHDLGGTNANNRYLQWSANQASAVSNGLRIDITPPVPGPGSLAVLGLGGLLAARRRRS